VTTVVRDQLLQLIRSIMVKNASTYHILLKLNKFLLAYNSIFSPKKIYGNSPAK
jgi:hypothetical protein